MAIGRPQTIASTPYRIIMHERWQKYGPRLVLVLPQDESVSILTSV